MKGIIMKILSTIIHSGIRVLYGKVFLVFCTCMFTSCVIDTVTLFGIRNSSNDTLYIELSESDSPGDLIYWCEDSIDLMPPTWPTDTTEIYINNKKVIIDKRFYALPDSTVFVCPCFFDTKDTCYIYAIKKQIIERYTLDKIRERKLYDRQVVTKKDFHDRFFEYRPVGMSPNSH